MIIADDPVALPSADALIGTWRRFGPTGPVYEIVGVAGRAANGPAFRIRIVETGEEIDYGLADILDDPRER